MINKDFSLKTMITNTINKWFKKLPYKPRCHTGEVAEENRLKNTKISRQSSKLGTRTLIGQLRTQTANEGGDLEGEGL